MGQMTCTNMESSQEILLTFQMLQLLGYAVCTCMGMQDHWKDTEEPSNYSHLCRQELRVWETEVRESFPVW